MGLGAPIDPLAFTRSPTGPGADSKPSLNKSIEPQLPLAATRPAAQTGNDGEQSAPVATAGSSRDAELSLPAVAAHNPAVPPDGGSAMPQPTLNTSRPTSKLASSPQANAGAPTTIAAPPRLSQARPAVQRAPRAEATEMATPRPLVGARPMGGAIQRAPLAGSPGQVRIRRGAEANELAGALDARAFTHSGEIYLPDSQGPLNGPKAQSLLAHEMTHVAQQRRLGSSLPQEDTAQGQHLEAQAAAAESSGRLPLAVSGVKDSPASSSEGSSPGSMSALAEATNVAPEGRDGAAAQRAPRASEAHFTNPDDQFKAQLDSNEAYMFEKFERRLRRLLISERERGGTLIDLL
jgi:Domain of unknown function (DUF4157)